MKKTKIFITLLLFILFSITITKLPVSTAERRVIYFKENNCLVCNELTGHPNGPSGVYNEEDDYIKKLENQGITVEIYDVVDEEASDLFVAYNIAYNIDKNDATVPIIFAGNQYFRTLSNIRNAVDDNTIYELSDDPLLKVTVNQGQIFDDITGIAGFAVVLFAGLLDGFNPCAIAMLLLFVSLLGFSDNKRFLILVSITYIFALFVSYFLIGTFLLNFLLNFSTEAHIISIIINWFIALLCLFLFFFNMYDFFMSKSEKYSKIKNQLPSWLQKYNKKIIKAFTNVINNETNKKGLFAVLGLTFILGITLSVTELICTGQIYLGIIYGIHYLDSFYAYIALFFYNLMFILPLVIIAIITIKGKGVMSTSNWIREHLHLIKLLTALFFLGISIYFFTRIF